MAFAHYGSPNIFRAASDIMCASIGVSHFWQKSTFPPSLPLDGFSAEQATQNHTATEAVGFRRTVDVLVRAFANSENRIR